MANTSYIKKEVEPWIRNWLASQFLGHKFEINNFRECVGNEVHFRTMT